MMMMTRVTMISQPLDTQVATAIVQTSLRLEAPQRMTMLRAQPSEANDSTPVPARQTMLRRPR
jgi:hypothetical protein